MPEEINRIVTDSITDEEIVGSFNRAFGVVFVLVLSLISAYLAWRGSTQWVYGGRCSDQPGRGHVAVSDRSRPVQQTLDAVGACRWTRALFLSTDVPVEVQMKRAGEQRLWPARAIPRHKAPLPLDQCSWNWGQLPRWLLNVLLRRRRAR
jgi:hypothetical protein